MIRQFYLENEYGDIYYFNHKNQTIISEISGLGFSLDLKYLEYSQFYQRSDYNIPLSEITETLVFLKGYQGYKAFVDFISKGHKAFKLYYENDAFKAYCCVDIASLSKAELVASTIQSQIIFKKLSLWLKEKTYEIIANGSRSGKVYPYMYPYFYSSSYEGKAYIKNEGLDQAPLVIEILGNVNNPEVLIKKNQEVVSILRLYLSAENANITINAIPSQQEMTMDESGVITDIYGLQDFELDNFIFLDHGDYEVEFKPGVSSESICKIKVLEGYLGI
ncbi:phage baseplate protein [Hujiaoplasma nucleasis]|uniref:Phage baseplate protein n=1 Tax=Hujiaoplasma nucleasis TaxID=2725268 RepID=A0A7L6N6H0_9MOLU|nr:hypothetical protein [Hujiaoplasma nucleasis]QLY40169.1 phage baseplate protein [Hujiaoplasma nucleasis]